MAGPRPALAIGDGYASSERGNNNQDLDGSPWSGGSKAGSVSEPEVTPVKKRFLANLCLPCMKVAQLSIMCYRLQSHWARECRTVFPRSATVKSSKSFINLIPFLI